MRSFIFESQRPGPTVRSFPVLVRSSCGLFPVLRPDLQTLPTTVKEVQSFLGFGNFYRRFIKGFSKLAQPLNDLLKKDKKFEWTLIQQQSFETLKKRFTEEPVLMMPDHSKPFQIEVDASKYTTGAILTQTDSNGD